MLADLNPYPAMKDSGVPRLGEIPADVRVVNKRTGGLLGESIGKEAA